MKNAQPTSRDKGIKEGRLDFTTPPLQISYTQTHTRNHSTSIHTRSLKTHNLAHAHTHTDPHTAPTKKQQHGLATQHDMFPQSD